MSRFTKISSIILLIAFLNYSFQQRDERQIEVTEILGTQTVPDYYAEEIEIRQFGQYGQLKSVIQTKKLSHFPNQQQANLEQPMLTITSAIGGTVSVKANSGSIFDVSQNINLEDGVKLSSIGENKSEKFSLNTESMKYTPNTNILWTDETVNAESLFDTSLFATYSATGFKMDLAKQQLNFNKNVVIHYLGKDER